MTQTFSDDPDAGQIHDLVDQYIDGVKEDLWLLNKQIHDHPETAWKEHKTHDAIAKFLEDQGRTVTRHAYDLETAFESRSGTKGRLVNFNSEYDALPGLGHACGHNLICIAGIAAYIALSRYIDDHPDVDGQVQLLGTPAEEGGGGKIALLNAGAYKDVEVSLMSHPNGAQVFPAPIVGIAGQPTLAAVTISASYTGRSAHAANNPWDGINALDAVVAAYNNISLLRQQIHPDERIHGAITSTPSITNAIPAYTSVDWTVRSGTIARLGPLVERVSKCIEGAAVATGCTLSLDRSEAAYADVKVNEPLAEAFQSAISTWGCQVYKSSTTPISASTDMGNVSNALPGLHAVVGIPVLDEHALPHNPEFAASAGTKEAFERFVVVAKALAVVGLKVWFDEAFVGRVKEDFGKEVGMARY